MGDGFIPYPWLESLWQGLMQRKEEGRLPHALLFTGPAGLGKQQLAIGLARSILCENPGDGGAACGHCRSCQLFSVGNHPDYFVIEPEEGKKSIAVDQIRQLDSFQALKGHYGRGKVILITPADWMNANAANALLKTLEEPTPGTVLILSTDRPMALLATIRSRCQSVAFQPVAPGVAIQWLNEQLTEPADEQSLLAIAGGSPLVALKWANEGYLERHEKLFKQLEQISKGAEPVSLASEWVDKSDHYALIWLYGWLSDMVRLKMNPGAAVVSSPNLRGRLQAQAERVDLKALFQLLERVQEARRLLHTQVSQLLMMEELLIAWSRVNYRSIAGHS